MHILRLHRETAGDPKSLTLNVRICVSVIPQYTPSIRPRIPVCWGLLVQFLGIWHLSLGLNKEVGSDKNVKNHGHGALFTALPLVWSLCSLLVLIIPLCDPFAYYSARLLSCVISLFTTSLDYFVFDLRTDHVFWMYLDDIKADWERIKLLQSQYWQESCSNFV